MSDRMGDLQFADWGRFCDYTEDWAEAKRAREAEKNLQGATKKKGQIIADLVEQRNAILKENAELNNAIKEANIDRCRLGKERNGFKTGVIRLHRVVEEIETGDQDMRFEDAKSHRRKINFLKKENAELKKLAKIKEKT